MKNILALSFIFSTTLFAHGNFNNMGEVHSKLLSNRGKEQFRKNIIFKKFEKAGYSNSNQYIEYLGEIDGKYDGQPSYDVKTKGVMLGTNSNLLSSPDTYVGVGLGYLKSNLKYEQENSKVRTYEIGYYIGKNIGNWVVIGHAGYSENKNIYANYKYRTKDYSLGVEGGYLYLLNEKTIIYPFVAFDWNQYTTNAYNGITENNDRIGSGSLGLAYAQEIGEKFLLTVSGEWIYDFSNREDIRLDNGSKISGLEVERDTGVFNLKLGYFIKPDFMISLGYNSFLNNKYYYDMFSITLSHNF